METSIQTELQMHSHWKLKMKYINHQNERDIKHALMRMKNHHITHTRNAVVDPLCFTMNLCIIAAMVEHTTTCTPISLKDNNEMERLKWNQ